MDDALAKQIVAQLEKINQQLEKITAMVVGKHYEDYSIPLLLTEIQGALENH
jgi:hypothetical protein